MSVEIVSEIKEETKEDLFFYFWKSGSTNEVARKLGRYKHNVDAILMLKDNSQEIAFYIEGSFYFCPLTIDRLLLLPKGFIKYGEMDGVVNEYQLNHAYNIYYIVPCIYGSYNPDREGLDDPKDHYHLVLKGIKEYPEKFCDYVSIEGKFKTLSKAETFVFNKLKQV